MAYRWVYMTAANLDEARHIGKALVERRLVACVNILGAMQSLYWWEGQIQEDQEVAFVAKTRAELVAPLTEVVRSLHSYSCPCVVALPMEAGNTDFLDWIGKETEAALA